MRLRDLAGTAALVAAGNLAAAAAGVVLRAAIAWRFGATADTDALLAAVQASDVFTTPVVWILGAAFIPTFARALERDPEAAWRIAATVLAGLAALFLVLAAGLTLAADAAASLMVGRTDAARLALTSRLIPLFAFTSIVAATGTLLTGVLQARGRFLVPAASLPVRSAVAAAAVILGGARWGIWGAVWGLAAGFVLQGLILAAAALPAVWRHGAIDPRHPGVREVGRRALPLLVGSFVLQANQLASVRFAADVAPGGVTAFTYAAGIAALAAVLVGQSTAEASFPALSRAAGAGDGGAAMRRGVSAVLRLTVVFGAIVSALVAATAPELVRVLFGHGLFAGTATDVTAAALRIYGLGLLVLVLQTVLARLFYAVGDNLVPQLLVLPAVALNLAVGPWAGARFGVPGVAAAGVASLGLLTVSLLAALDRRHGWLDRRWLVALAGRAVLMAAAVTAAVSLARLLPLPGLDALGPAAIRLAVLAGAGGLAAAAVALALDEFGIRSRITARAASRPPASPDARPTPPAGP